MTDIPIIFSAPMILALLDGRKTMTRRLAWKPIKPMMIECEHGYDTCPKCDPPKPSPWQRVKPGDRLWVRESWRAHSTFDGTKPRDIPKSTIWYLADTGYQPKSRLRVSMFMPRWASRLTLIVTATKIERLQEITVEDAIAEGMTQGEHEILNIPQIKFSTLWQTLHGPGSWNENPEVVALTFEVHKTNIDSMPKAEAA